MDGHHKSSSNSIALMERTRNRGWNYSFVCLFQIRKRTFIINERHTKHKNVYLLEYTANGNGNDIINLRLAFTASNLL